MANESLFWADQIAEQVVERAKREGVVPNIKCQQTPSGGKHIGNLNDVIRAYFPYKSLAERGEKATFVHTTDDRDPLKDVPKRLPDLDGKWYESSSLMDMQEHFGKPLYRIPDPFGCCKSWSIHFTEVWMRGVRMLGMEPELHSTNKVYEDGKFEPYIRMVFEKKELVGKIVSKFQRTKSSGYIPFDAICPSCGRLMNVSDFNLEKRQVFFTCKGKAIKKKVSSGCGFEGWVPWAEGKLQWRFEWPALWGIFNTTYEPFGKDHAEGSWKSGVDIMKFVYGKEPPIPYVYEFFMVNGEKMSASVGNVHIVQDMLMLVEPEVFLYFYTKKPGKQRNLDLRNINLLVEDFEKAERIYYGEEKEENEREEKNIKRSYEMSVGEPQKTQPVRVPYLHASMLAQSGLSGEQALEALRKTGHVDRLDKAEQERVLKRLELAGCWAANVADDRYRFSLRDGGDVKLSRAQKAAVDDLAGELPGKEWSEGELTVLMKDIAARHGLGGKDFYQGVYRKLFGKDSGPRLSSFLLSVGADKAVKVLGK